MGKLGDLFVHIGVKKDKLSQGLNESKKEVKGFGETLKGIKATAGAVWAAVGVIAFKAADKFAHTSQRFGDAWDNTTARMKGAWDVFTQSLTNWDWEGFGNRIRNAMSAAGEVQKSDDLAAEVQRSIQLKKDEQQGILNQDLITMRNMKLSYKEREEAAKDYLARMKAIYDQEYLYRKSNADVKLKDYLTRISQLEYNDANVAALKDFIKRVAPNENLYNSYLALANKGSNDPLAKIAKGYSGSGDADINKVTDALHAATVAANGLESENQRVYSMLNSLGAKMQEHGETVKEDTKDVLGFIDAYEQLNIQLEKGTSIAGKAVKQGESGGLLGNLMGVGNSEENGRAFLEWMDKVQYASEELAYSLQDGLISALEEMGEAMAGVDGKNFGTVMKALLSPIADAAITAGTIILTTGEAVEAFKAALGSLQGPAAIAAGTALIAIGAAAKAGLAAIGSKSSSSAGTSSVASSASTANTQYEDMNINVHIEGKLKGSDIVLAAQKTQSAWAR